MLRIVCPHCGPRDETELVWGGEAEPRRPADPAGASDRDWTDFLYLRGNREGAVEEWWHCAAGCRSWFRLTRDTATDAIGDTGARGGDAPA